MTNLDSILKSRDITLSTKVCLVKAMVFLVVMYGCECWTIKKAEHRRMDGFELRCWRRLLRVPWTARRSNQSILKEISPRYSFEGRCWSWNSNTLRPHGLQHTRWSFTISQSLLKLIFFESVMPSNHLILCWLLLLLPSIFSSTRVFSNESVLHIRWPKYWSFSFSTSPSKEYVCINRQKKQ